MILLGQNNDLKIKHDKLETDMALLRKMMDHDMLYNMKESYKRKLRYHQGRLNNAINECNVMSVVDINLREEEIKYCSDQIMKIDAIIAATESYDC